MIRASDQRSGLAAGSGTLYHALLTLLDLLSDESLPLEYAVMITCDPQAALQRAWDETHDPTSLCEVLRAFSPHAHARACLLGEKAAIGQSYKETQCAWVAAIRAAIPCPRLATRTHRPRPRWRRRIVDHRRYLRRMRAVPPGELDRRDQTVWLDGSTGTLRFGDSVYSFAYVEDRLRIDCSPQGVVQSDRPWALIRAPFTSDDIVLPPGGNTATRRRRWYLAMAVARIWRHDRCDYDSVWTRIDPDFQIHRLYPRG